MKISVVLTTYNASDYCPSITEYSLITATSYGVNSTGVYHDRQRASLGLKLRTFCHDDGPSLWRLVSALRSVDSFYL